MLGSFTVGDTTYDGPAGNMIAQGQPLTPVATVEVMARYATIPATDYAD